MLILFLWSSYKWGMPILGVNFKDLVPKIQVDFNNLTGKSIAVDAYNALYQFLAIIRQPDGTPLKDNEGRVTSHLSGVLYRTSNLVGMGIKVAYVFDGAPPILKRTEIKRRKIVKQQAATKYRKAIAEGRREEAYMYAQATSQLKDYMEQDSKKLLSLMGIPWVQAPEEGEAQAAHMTKNKDTDFCGSQDYDSILFGTPILVRNITISGRRKLPRKPVYVEVVPEIVELKQTLEELGVTYEQLVDVGILVGTDYNPRGVKGIGPKTALELIKEYGKIDDIPEDRMEFSFFQEDLQRIRNLFLHPKVRDDYILRWQEPDLDGVVNFLCRERDFSEDRVRKALEKMMQGMREEKSRTTLDSFFG